MQRLNTARITSEPRLYLKDSELDQGAHLLRSAFRRLRDKAHEAADCPLGEGELDILVELFISGDLPVNALRDAIGAPKQSLARRLNDLQERDLVERAKCHQDGRRRIVRLTESGRTIAERAASGWRNALSIAYKAAGPERVNNMRILLASLADPNAAASEEPKETG